MRPSSNAARLDHCHQLERLENKSSESMLAERKAFQEHGGLICEDAP